MSSISINQRSLTHFNAVGDACMVDVSSKLETHRTATAEGYIKMQPETFTTLSQGTSQKGDVLGVARLAGILAAKRTCDLIPLCHPIHLTAIEIHFELEHDFSRVKCRASTNTLGRTGIEMEAMTATMIALLTIYDMLKAVDRSMAISEVQLTEKRGGKSGHWTRKTQ